MKEKLKKIIFRWYGLAIVLLVLAITVFSLTTIIKIDIKEENYSKFYQEGRYTSVIEDDSEIKIGIGVVFNLVKNIKDVSFVVSVQNIETDIKKIETKIKDYESNPYFDEESEEYIELKDKLSLYEKDLSNFMSKFDEKDIERLNHKLKEDKGFINILKFIYLWIGGLEFETPDSVPGNYELDGYYIIGSLFSLLSSFVIVGFIILFSIIFIIKCISKILNYLRRLKREYAEWFIKDLLKFPIVPYTILLTIPFIVLVTFSRGDISLGVGFIGAYIVLGVLTVIKLFKNYVFSEDKDINVIVKKGIAITSLVLFVIFLCTFIKIDLFKEYGNVMLDISDVQYKAEFDKGFAPDINIGTLNRNIYKKISESNDFKITLIVFGLVVFSVLSIITLLRFIARVRKEEFGYGKYLNKTKAIFVMPVILLILSIVPTLLAVHSEEEATKAYENGMFVIWYDEHLEEGTEPYLEYKTLLLARDATNEIIEELKEPKDKEKETLKKAKEYLAEVNKMIKEIEQRPKRPTTIIVMGVLLILSEIAYVVVPKCIGPKEEKKPIEEPQN